VAPQAVAYERQQAERVVANHVGDVGRRHRQQRPAGVDRTRDPRGLQASQSFVERRATQQQQASIGEPAEVAGAISRAGVHALDFGRRAQPFDPVVDLAAIVVDRVVLGCRKDHVQLVEAADTGEIGAKSRNDPAVVGQQRQDVRIE
jgi:hypothetical protein